MRFYHWFYLLVFAAGLSLWIAQKRSPCLDDGCQVPTRQVHLYVTQ
jgi:hypothetical protein